MAIDAAAVLNGTLNSTVTNGSRLFASHQNSWFGLLVTRWVELISAPLTTPNMLWIVTPLAVATLLMEFYFGRYQEEDLGWNTAVANSLVLIFVAIDLLRFVYGDTSILTADVRDLATYNLKATIIALAVASGGFLLMFTEFFHVLPKKFAFFISSTLPVNVVAYVAITLVYTQIPLDFYTLGAAVLLFFLLMGLFRILKSIEPSAKEKPPKLFETKEGLAELEA